MSEIRVVTGEAVFQNCFGRVVGFFMCSFGSRMAYMAELVTVVCALDFAKQKGSSHLGLELNLCC